MEAVLTPLEWQAVKAVAANADDTRLELKPGEGQEVDLLLRITGTVDVGEDSEPTETVEPSAVDVLAWILAEAFGDDENRNQLLSRLRDSTEPSTGKLVEVEERYRAMATMAIAAVSPTVKSMYRGSVRGRLEVVRY